ncbi:DUF4973 domain-containing protein [Phocaeicola sp.]
MKKIYYYVMTLVTVLSLAACNDEWKDELFMHSVSFAKNGVYDIHMRYNKEGKVSYQLPVLVSGSTEIDKAIDVRVGLDTDTLDVMNYERFRDRKDLYFRLLDQKYYDIPSMTVNFPAGSNKELLDIDFKLGDLDMSEKYVLPLTIEEGPGYVPNYRKQYRKALLNVLPFNDYSGSYSATNAMISAADDPGAGEFSMDTRNAFVVDDHSIFFYAGAIDEELQSRGKYKVVAEFIPSGEASTDGIVKLSSPNPDIHFEGEGTFLISTEMDQVLPYLEHRYVTILMEYEYDDLSTITPFRYKVQGSMVMERKRNILMPDEDQAIEW